MPRQTFNKIPEEIKEYLAIDGSSPSGLRWFKTQFRSDGLPVSQSSKGKRAGAIKKDKGYYKLSFRGKSYYNHRVILFLLGYDVNNSDKTVDHINGDKLDNRPENLRFVDQAVNVRNIGREASNEAGLLGVTYYKDDKIERWVACWKEKGKEKRKSFSVNKWGFDVAKRKAISARLEAIDKLNKEGYGYTERHYKNIRKDFKEE